MRFEGIKFKHFISLFLISFLLLSTFPYISYADSNFTMAGFDGDGSLNIWEDNLFFSRMQERTNISFKFLEFTDYDEWQNKKEEIFSSNDLPDCFFKAALTIPEQLKYAESNQLIDLRPYLEQYAPNFYNILKNDDELKSAITLPNGEIVALPAIYTQPVENAVWINKTWLDNLNLDMPKNTDDFKHVLEAFKNNDPNMNNKKDEIPMTYLGIWDLKFMAHAFGIIANDYNLYIDNNGIVNFAATEDNYFEFIDYFKELYSEELIDEDGFSNSTMIQKISDSDAPITYGVMLTPNPMNIVPSNSASQFVVMPPLEYESKQIYRSFSGKYINGTFAISNKCENPEALLSWVDYLYTEEGSIMASTGIKDNEYTLYSDGKWSWNVNDETEMNTIINNHIISNTGYMPGIQSLDFQRRFDNDEIVGMIDSLLVLNNYTVYPFDYYWITEDELNDIEKLQNILGDYVDKTLSRFILGELPLNNNSWNAYKAELNVLGLDQFVAMWQEIVDK